MERLRRIDDSLSIETLMSMQYFSKCSIVFDLMYRAGQDVGDPPRTQVFMYCRGYAEFR